MDLLPNCLSHGLIDFFQLLEKLCVFSKNLGSLRKSIIVNKDEYFLRLWSLHQKNIKGFHQLSRRLLIKTESLLLVICLETGVYSLRETLMKSLGHNKPNISAGFEYILIVNIGHAYYVTKGLSKSLNKTIVSASIWIQKSLFIMFLEKLV